MLILLITRQFLFCQASLKLFEKLVYNRLLNYLSQHSMLSYNQYGFRNNHDTSMAVFEMIDKITNATDSNTFSIGILLIRQKRLTGSVTISYSISLSIMVYVV